MRRSGEKNFYMNMTDILYSDIVKVSLSGESGQDLAQGVVYL